MNNSKAIQLTLPLDIVQSNMSTKYMKIVKQSWQITFSKQYMTSVFTKRVMGLIAAQIQNEKDIKEFYQISADKIIKEVQMAREEVYRKMKEVMYELSTVIFYLEDKKNGKIIPRHLLDTTRFENPTSYYNGKLTIAFNPQLANIITELSNFSTYELYRYTNFKSWYSMRLYEILYAFIDIQEVVFNIENYRDWMGCGAKINPKTGNPMINSKTGKIIYEKYSSHSDAIKYTTLEPLKEFKNLNVEFKVEPVYALEGKGRRPIEKIKFSFTKERTNIKELIQQWIGTSDNFARFYTGMKKYKISDKNIVLYSRVIGKKRTGELLVEWDKKQASKNPIKNIKIYCNKVFKSEGEKCFKELMENV